MTSIVQTNCPACSNRMRFNRPSQKIAAVRCPVCRNFFEVESDKLEEEAVVAIVVDQAPIIATLIDDPSDQTPTEVARPVQPGHPPKSKRPKAPKPNPPATDIFADDEVTVEAVEVGSTSAFPSASPPQRSLKSVGGSSKSKNSYQPGSTQGSITKKRIPIIIAAASSLVAILVIAFVGYKYFSSGSNDTMAAKLAGGYQTCLEDLRDYMKSSGEKPDPQELDKRVESFRNHLLLCVRHDRLAEADVAELRERLKTVYDLQQETKKTASQLPAAATRGSRIDQLPTLIDLISKQHSYGVRQLAVSSNEANAFCKDALGSFRLLDQKLARALDSSIDSELPEIANCLDQLESEYLRYTEKSDSRTEMSFEQKQVFDCGEDFRRWCLGELQLKGYGDTCQSLQKEIDTSKSRLDQSLKSHKLIQLKLTALERVKNRINGVVDSGTALAKTENPSSTPSNVKSRGDSNKSQDGGLNSQIASTTPPGTSPGSASGILPSSSSAGSSNSRSSYGSERVDASPKPESTAEVNPFALPGEPNSKSTASKTTSSTSTTSGTTSGTTTALNLNDVPNFPPAKFQGFSSLTLKVVSNRPDQKLRLMGATIASRFGGVADVQVRENCATISISNYNGKIFDAIKFVDFGKVEICDSQSRTLFVIDNE